VQFLHQNARSLERLAVDLAEQADRRLSYRIFLRRVDQEFFRLASAYVSRVLRVILPPPPPGPFLICAVGTRGHQDDIDVAVIDRDPEARPVLERALSGLSSQMLRYASALDHYLAEAVGGGTYCLTIEELRRFLFAGPPHFVVATELLRAERLAGSRELLQRLRDEVIAEYYYRPGQDNTRHEMYLRGILGEIRGLLLRPPSPGRVSPKDDGLRLITGLTAAFKAIESLQATQPRDLIRQLMGRRPDLRKHLRRLEDSHAFLETFRHLAHILVAEREEVEVEGPAARENLQRITSAMGYRDRGPIHGIDHLLVHYHEAVETVHEVAGPLMETVAHHLAERSVFSRWTRKRRPEEAPTDLAREFAITTRAFRGVRFWDDVLDALASWDGRLLDTFLEGFESLGEGRRHRLAAAYARWGCNAPYALLTLLTLLAQRRRLRKEDSAGLEITRSFLDRVGRRSDDIRALARVFRFYPDLMNRFLLTLEELELGQFHDALDSEIGDPEVSAARDRLQALIDMHRHTSRYVKRVLGRVTLRHPATVLALSDDAALRTLAQGRLAAGERHPRAEEQKGLLGDYYDTEFLRLAMGTLRKASRADTVASFTELTSTYLSDIFDICLREVEREAGRRLPDRDLLAVYLTGGYARGRPYDEDYDLVALTVSTDEEARGLAERAVAKMNRQIARRGVIAQYRFGDRLGHFVTRMDELEELLAGEEDDLFVDRCQLLGSRMVAGSPRVEEALIDRILRPQVFIGWKDFAARVAREVEERRERYSIADSSLLHLKEMPGGLREIDLTLAAARARLGLREPGGERLFGLLARLDAERSAEYRALGAASDFLVQVRSVYRVTGAASDVIEREFLELPARLLGYTGLSEGAPAARLFADIRRKTTSAAQAVNRLLLETC
jgi:hypothetical protein